MRYIFPLQQDGIRLNKIYKYFCYLFTGSLFPFLITEFYVQDYFTFWCIAILAGVILTVCVCLNYLKVKFVPRSEIQDKKIDYLNWTQKKEKPKQKLSTITQMNKSKEDRMREIVDIRNKVDKIIEINKL
jgi:hypothetical protein